MTTKDGGLSTKTVKSVAKLARLYEDMSDEQAEKLVGDLSGIVDMADQLQSIDTGGIDYLDGMRTVTLDELRDDVVWDGEEFEMIRKRIIEHFPNSQSNLLVIPGIFDGD